MKKFLSIASAAVLAGGMIVLTGVARAEEGSTATFPSNIAEQLAQDETPSMEPEAASSAAGEEQAAEPDQSGSATESTGESSDDAD